MCRLGEHRVRLGGCVKGAGMISPSMATMLCFITTDANMPTDNLRKAVLECVEESFNRITIDGDMSTNDTVIVLANGASGMPAIRRNGKRCRQFRQALRWLMLELAKAVVRDGERVTKFVTVNVTRARSGTFGWGQAVMGIGSGVHFGASEPRHDGAAIPETPALAPVRP